MIALPSLSFDPEKLRKLVGAYLEHPYVRALAPFKASAFLDDPTYLSFCAEVPIKTKYDLFGHSSSLLIHAINQSPRGLKLIPAAGTTSNLLSYRFYTEASDVTQIESLSKLFQTQFALDPRECVFLNCYPTGISLPPSIHSVECGSKPEVLRLALKATKKNFKYAAIIAQPQFIKYSVEHSFIAPEHASRILLVLGGDWYPATFFKPLDHLLGLAPDSLCKRTLSFFGVAEVGLGMGILTPAHHELRSKRSDPYSMIFSADTSRFFVESVNKSLVVTPWKLDPLIPLLRYNTGDHAETFVDEQGKEYFTISARKPDGQYPISADRLEHTLGDLPNALGSSISDYWITKSKILFERSPRKGSLPEQALEIFQSITGIHPQSLELVDKIRRPERNFDDLVRKPSRYE